MKITKTTPYPLKINTNNPLIPLNVYQTWNTKKLPLKMNERREILKNMEFFKSFLFLRILQPNFIRISIYSAI